MFCAMSAEPRAPEQLSHADREARQRIEILKCVLASALHLGLKHNDQFVQTVADTVKNLSGPVHLRRKVYEALDMIPFPRTHICLRTHGAGDIRFRYRDAEVGRVTLRGDDSKDWYDALHEPLRVLLAADTELQAIALRLSDIADEIGEKLHECQHLRDVGTVRMSDILTRVVENVHNSKDRRHGSRA